MRKALRILRKFVFWTFFVCLFFTTVVTVILYAYEDEIKQYAIDEINSHLETDIKVRNIELSIFHDFPYASLQFEHVFIADAYKERESEDTLLYAENMFFNFSVMDIWQGDYKVKRIRAENGQLNLKTNADGDYNYGIVKSDPEADTASSNFEFMLELLKLKNIKFDYTNLSTRQFYQVDITEGLVRGDFTATNYNLLAEGDLFVHQIRSNSFSLIQEKEAKLDLDLNINTEGKKYTFNRGDLDIEEMPFKITGFVDSSEIDMQVTGHDVQLNQLVNSLVDESFAETKKYDGEGIIDFRSQIKGSISKTEMPSVTADFSLAGGSLIEPKNKLKIYDVNLIGSYQNAQGDRKEKLEFKNLSLKLLNSYFIGSAIMEDFSQPVLNSKMKGDLDLAAFDRFFGFKDVEKIGGHLKLDLETVVQFFDPQYRKDKFEIVRANGDLELSDVMYKSANDHLAYEKINGNILIHGKDAAVKDLSIKTQKSDILLSGALKNFVPFIEGSDGLGLVATIESDFIDLNEFLGESNKERKGPPRVFELPAALNLNTELHIREVKWDNHNFRDISGKLLCANRKASLKQLKLKTLGGSVWANLTLNNALENGNVIEGKINFTGVNVKSLFEEWENFDQESVTHEQISGKAKGKVDLLLFFDPYFSIIKEKMYVLSDIELSQGALTNLETMKSVTDYMRSNKGLKLLLNKHIDQFEEKLLDLRFSTLNNKIEIKDGRITIPKMKIKTNAIDVDLFGWHDLDNMIEYHFSFRFRELKSKPEYTEFGKIEDDGLGLIVFLTMSGHIDDPEFALDKDERKNHIKENLTHEKDSFKSIMKSEFGMFKRDSTVKQMEQENKHEVEFIFYEEEIQETEKDTVMKKKNKKFTGKFFDKLKKQQEEQDEVEVEYENN